MTSFHLPYEYYMLSINHPPILAKTLYSLCLVTRKRMSLKRVTNGRTIHLEQLSLTMLTRKPTNEVFM